MRSHRRLRRCATSMLCGLMLGVASRGATQDTGPAPNLIAVALVDAPNLTFPNPADSNSPVVWTADGQLVMFNSVNGHTVRSIGTTLEDLATADAVGTDSDDDSLDEPWRGHWLEAVVRDDDTGRLYGWYHLEIKTECPQGDRFWPQIGATLSDDDGTTWVDLGLILTPRDGTVTCETDHPVTNGGIGDFSVVLDDNPDPSSRSLFFAFSSYGGELAEQGISFARMLWIDRDQPLDRSSGESKALKWDGEGWTAPGIGGQSIAIFHDDRQVSWTSAQNNGFWGPSVHWNMDLQKFIVLMARSKGGNYDTDGIYMSYTTTLDDPLSWVQPKLVISKGVGWYPQVVGDPSIGGTDRLSGTRARFFDMGRSRQIIVFSDEPTTEKVTGQGRR